MSREVDFTIPFYKFMLIIFLLKNVSKLILLMITVLPFPAKNLLTLFWHIGGFIMLCMFSSDLILLGMCVRTSSNAWRWGYVSSPWICILVKYTNRCLKPYWASSHWMPRMNWLCFGEFFCEVMLRYVFQYNLYCYSHLGA